MIRSLVVFVCGVGVVGCMGVVSGTDGVTGPSIGSGGGGVSSASGGGSGASGGGSSSVGGGSGVGGGKPSDAGQTEGPPPSIDCLDAGQPTTYGALGDGLPGRPFVLCNKTQVQSLAGTPSAWKSAYALGVDIDLAGVAFSPIGTPTQPFTGTFDGQGHVISNLTIDTPAESDVGFFGVISSPAAEVRRLHLRDATVSGTDHVGVLAGTLDRGRVLNCSSSGTATGTGQSTGGLVGFGWLAPIISSSWSSATVNGNDRVGGVAGTCAEGGYIANSYATGSITGASAVGGVVGHAHATTIISTYSTANVTQVGGGDSVGGFIGSNCATIIGSFAAGNVTAATGTSVDRFGTCGCCNNQDNFYFSGSTCQSGGGGCNGQLDGVTGVSTLATLFDRTQLPTSAWDFTQMWQSGASGPPTLAPLFFDPSTFDCAAHASDPHSAGGRATPEQPTLICTAQQFTSLGGDNPWWAPGGGRLVVSYFLQLADLDFAGAALTPIGTTDSFRGVYDGNGRTLSNFTITSNNGLVGLFGEADCAHLSRIGVIGATVTGTQSANADNKTGTIVGDLFGTLNDSYAVMGSVTGGSNVGGLAGFAHDIEHSFAAVTVKATAGQAGGLAGCGNEVALHGSFGASNVSATGGGGPLTAPGGDVSSSYYDATRSCSGCSLDGTAINASGYFFDTSHAPLSSWDFDHVWQGSPASFPTLR
jgi:hypothetical protein